MKIPPTNDDRDETIWENVINVLVQLAAAIIIKWLGSLH